MTRMLHRYALADDAPFVDPLARIIAECAVIVQRVSIRAVVGTPKSFILMA